MKYVLWDNVALAAVLRQRAMIRRHCLRHHHLLATGRACEHTSVLVKKMSSEEKERKRPWATVWTLGLLLVVAIASMGLVRRSIDLSFGNGSFVRVTPASLWSSCGSGSSSKIFYHPNGVKSGTVALWQD